MIRLSNWRRYGDTFQMSNLLDRRRFEKIALRRFFYYSRLLLNKLICLLIIFKYSLSPVKDLLTGSAIISAS